MFFEDGGIIPRVSRVNRERLRELVAEVGPSARAISLRAGQGPTAIKDILSGRSRNPGVATLQRIAEALGVPLAELMDGDPAELTSTTNVKLAPRFLPVRYRVQAGLWHDADTEDPPEQVLLAVLPDPRYSRYPQWLEKVLGDSVNLKIPAGHYAHVVDAIEMGYAPKTGDWVVVERRRDQGAIRERTIKQVDVSPGGVVRLFPRSTNPKWADAVDLVAGSRPGEPIEVEIVGLVIGAYDAEF